MRKNYWSLAVYVLVMVCLHDGVLAQSYWFGGKIGPSLAFQKWNEFDNGGLLAPNVDFFLETMPESKKSAFYGQIGFHTRGSSMRYGGFGLNTSSLKFKFHNASMEFGAKKMIDTQTDIKPFYMIGARAEYTVATNLSSYEAQASAFYPNDAYVNRFVYGVTFGGGFEKNFDEFINSFLEITFCPDLREQYIQPPIFGVRDPFGNKVTISERIVRNYSLEVKVGLKFLRKIIYID